MTEDEKDIGHYLEVPEEEREDTDPAPELNDDADFDVTTVPDGEVVELSTAADSDEEES